MSERIVRIDLTSGVARIVSLEQAVSELCAAGLYSEIAPRLRQGEAYKLPSGLAFRAVSALGDRSIDRLPPSAIN